MINLLLSLLILTRFIYVIESQENAYTSVESIREALKLDSKIARFLELNLKELDEYRELVQQYLDERGMMENELKMVFHNHENWDEKLMNSKLARNPLIAFQTIRRIAVDVYKLSARLTRLADDLDTLVEEDIKDNKNVKVTYNEDLMGAATGILRLQSTYHMAASDLVDGRIKHLNTSIKFTVSDCLLLAQSAKEMNALDYYVEWRELANFLCRKMMDDEDAKTGGCFQVTEPLLMEAIIEHDETRSTYVREFAKNPEYQMESHVFPKKLQHISATEQRMRINEKKLHGPKNENSLCFISNELLDEMERSKLTCHFLRNPDDPFVTLQRFNMEVQSRKPLIMTIHNVISDDEADLIKDSAKPELRRSLITGDSDYSGISELRISQTGWIGDDHNSRISTISKRIARITGLNTDGTNAEPFQVVNYGIGGLFSPHYDALDSEEEFNKKLNDSDYMGNRIVTFILYLSDVELGGATYFPNANVSVYPKKGSATMWYNLDDSGNLDENTFHGGCPVLYGSKWIANKWILERGQLFRKPCLAKNTS